MKESQKNRLPVLPLLAAVMLLGLVFYVRSESKDQVDQKTDEELTQSAVALPEDKIINFVVDKVTDVLRLFPQKAQVTTGD